jgi:DNA-binding MarR family transcriptional regulator
MRIQDRDLKVLRLAYDHGFLLSRHAEKYFTSYSITRRRISILEYAGLIIQKQSPIWARERLIVLTRIGRVVAETKLTYRILHPVKIRPGRLLHDAELIRARLRLDELWQGRFVPEALLPPAQDVPDCAYAFDSGRKFYVELENTHKAKDRFIGRLRRMGDATAVLYIATTAEVERSIRRRLELIPEAPAGVLLLEELERPAPKLWSHRNQLSLFHRRDF